MENADACNAPIILCVLRLRLENSQAMCSEARTERTGFCRSKIKPGAIYVGHRKRELIVCRLSRPAKSLALFLLPVARVRSDLGCKLIWHAFRPAIHVVSAEDFKQHGNGKKDADRTVVDFLFPRWKAVADRDVTDSWIDSIFFVDARSAIKVGQHSEDSAVPIDTGENEVKFVFAEPVVQWFLGHLVFLIVK